MFWKKDLKEQDARSWYIHGTSLHRQGDKNQAAHAFLHAHALRTDDATLALAVAEALYELECNYEAQAAFRHVTNLDPECLVAYRKLGDALLRTGDTHEASKVLGEVLDIHTGDLEIRLLLATCSAKNGALENALGLLAQAAKRWPEHPEPFRRIARIHRKHGPLGDEIKAWKKVIELDDTDGDAVRSLALAYSQQAEHQEAQRLLVDLCLAEPEAADNHTALGLVYLAAQKPQAAEEAFHEALLRAPEVAKVHYLLGLARKRSGRIEQSILSLQRATALAPFAPAYFELSLALRDQEDLPAAREAVVKAAALSPGDQRIQKTLDEIVLAGIEARLRTEEQIKPKDNMSASMLGTLEHLAFPELLKLLGARQVTGTLVIKGASGVSLIQLLRGEIAHADAPSTRRLGEYLLTSGTINEQQLEDALDTQRNSPQAQPARLGRILVQKGALNEIQLQEAWRTQVLLALREAQSWSHGQFSFQAMREKAEDSDVELTMSVEQALLELTKDRTSSSPASAAPGPAAPKDPLSSTETPALVCISGDSEPTDDEPS